MWQLTTYTHPWQVGKVAWWISLIHSISFNIEHIPGRCSNIANAHSRMWLNAQWIANVQGGHSQGRGPLGQSSESGIQPMVTTLLNFPEVFKGIAKHQHDDQEVAKIITDAPRSPGYSMRDSILLFQALLQNTPRVVLPRKLFDVVFHRRQYICVLRNHWQSSRPIFGLKTCSETISNHAQCQQSKQAPNTGEGHLASEVEQNPCGPCGPTSPVQKRELLHFNSGWYLFKIYTFLPVKNTRASTTVEHLNLQTGIQLFYFTKFIISDIVSNFRSSNFCWCVLTVSDTYYFAILPDSIKCGKGE